MKLDLRELALLVGSPGRIHNRRRSDDIELNPRQCRHWASRNSFLSHRELAVALVLAGDVVHRWPGIVHDLLDCSPDMEYLEIASPADFKSVKRLPASDKVPPVTSWK